MPIFWVNGRWVCGRLWARVSGSGVFRSDVFVQIKGNSVEDVVVVFFILAEGGGGDVVLQCAEIVVQGHIAAVDLGDEIKLEGFVMDVQFAVAEFPVVG